MAGKTIVGICIISASRVRRTRLVSMMPTSVEVGSNTAASSNPSAIPSIVADEVNTTSIQATLKTMMTENNQRMHIVKYMVIANAEQVGIELTSIINNQQRQILNLVH